MDKQIEDLYKVFQEFSKVSTDSRKVEEGSIFFALKGPNFNGNEYAQKALDQGAAIVVVDEKGHTPEDRSIVVKDVLTTLQSLSKYHRSRLEIPIIGITGSNGKTTSKELIKCVLDTKYKVCATQGNLNNHIGVPLSILSIRPDHDIGVIEMGTNGHGEIEFLCDLARPEYGLITSIGKAHLEGLGSIEGVIAEKTALYRSVARTNGHIVYNEDSIYLKDQLPTNTYNIAYGIKGSQAVELKIDSAFPAIVGKCIRGSNKLELRSRMYGEYNISNIIAALTIGDLFDVDIDNAVQAINQYDPTNNRSEVKHYRGANIYLDAYNANPSSVALVIDQYSKSSVNKILILGDMLEVGEGEDREHNSILTTIDAERFENVILLGELYCKHRDQFSSFEFFNEYDSLKKYFDSLDLEGKNVLLKGSRGMRLERLIT